MTEPASPHLQAANQPQYVLVHPADVPAPDSGSKDDKRWRATLAVWLVLGAVVWAGIGVGGFVIGKASEDELGAAKAAGVHRGEIAGAAAGRQRAQSKARHDGYKKAYTRGYRKSYRSAYDKVLNGGG